ncbi:MAG: preprotein translocase subunit SecG, partial [Deltaproteobacteria bacterium]|nr:preprotein translocase subunit SecG [Deltaproteobacteria bacterium]
MFTFLSVIYVMVCIFLIMVVLLQSGKGGGMGALGGQAAGSQTVFGGAGAGNFLTRLTAICAALFMILSAALAYLSSSGEQSLERAATEEAASSVSGDDESTDDGADSADDGAEAPDEEAPPADIGFDPDNAPGVVIEEEPTALEIIEDEPAAEHAEEPAPAPTPAP